MAPRITCTIHPLAFLDARREQTATAVIESEHDASARYNFTKVDDRLRRTTRFGGSDPSTCRIFPRQLGDHATGTAGFLTGPADIDQDVAATRSGTNRINGLVLQTAPLNRIEVREIESGKPEIAVVPCKCNGIALAETEAAILITNSCDCMHRLTTAQINDADDTPNEIVGKQVAQAV